ncbi:hypothetical protein [Amycolatopsis taiwanensis]|uniref:Uncharacterized protein n=1 Tax=Amycolatopsis taiwanensis TaxID=342230 RepID=A0A9W6VEN0_9PSEU|nr:hypothetical protein [Amycolatopsis taiwanensis]GLY63969.1 hypothetical protein Atai01_05880 [Amycolatopsis taiwanensis]
MVRTILRSGSGDLVADVRLTDRTGIVAASTPPPADPPSPELGEPESGELRPVAPAGGGSIGGVLRRVRRQASFACAAVGLVALGWIGGGIFAHEDVAQVPAIATGNTGVLVNEDQSSVPAPPPPEVTPLVPATAGSPSPTPAAKTKPGAGSRKATDDTARHSRSEPAGTPTSPAGLPRADAMLDEATRMMDSLTSRFAQLQWFIDAYNQADGALAGRQF